MLEAEDVLIYTCLIILSKNNNLIHINIIVVPLKNSNWRYINKKHLFGSTQLLLLCRFRALFSPEFGVGLNLSIKTHKITKNKYQMRLFNVAGVGVGEG